MDCDMCEKEIEGTFFTINIYKYSDSEEKLIDHIAACQNCRSSINRDIVSLKNRIRKNIEWRKNETCKNNSKKRSLRT